MPKLSRTALGETAKRKEKKKDMKGRPLED
jgi:hypothetical protein